MLSNRERDRDRERESLSDTFNIKLTGFSNLKRRAKSNIKMRAVDLDIVYL